MRVFVVFVILVGCVTTCVNPKTSRMVCYLFCKVVERTKHVDIDIISKD